MRPERAQVFGTPQMGIASFVAGKDNLADILTKPQAVSVFTALMAELENFMVDVADDGFQLTAELENVTEECSTDELADGMIQTEACNWGSPPTACSMDAVSDGGIFFWTMDLKSTMKDAKMNQ